MASKKPVKKRAEKKGQKPVMKAPKKVSKPAAKTAKAVAKPAKKAAKPAAKAAKPASKPAKNAAKDAKSPVKAKKSTKAVRPAKAVSKKIKDAVSRKQERLSRFVDDEDIQELEEELDEVGSDDEAPDEEALANGADVAEREASRLDLEEVAKQADRQENAEKFFHKHLSFLQDYVNRAELG